MWSPLAEGDDDVHGQRTRGEGGGGEGGGREGGGRDGEARDREECREQHDGRKRVQHTDQPPTAAASFLAATPTAVPPIESSSEPRTSPALPSSILAITQQRLPSPRAPMPGGVRRRSLRRRRCCSSSRR